MKQLLLFVIIQLSINLNEEDDALGNRKFNHCSIHGIAHFVCENESVEKADKRQKNYFTADIYEHRSFDVH